MTRTSAAVLALSVCLAAPARAQDVPAGESLSLSAGHRRRTGAGAGGARGAERTSRWRGACDFRPAFAPIRRSPSSGARSRAGPTTATEVGDRMATRALSPRCAGRGCRRRSDRGGTRRGGVAPAARRRRRCRLWEVAAAARELAITDEVLAAASSQLELLRARAAQGSTPTLDRDMVDVDVRNASKPSAWRRSGGWRSALIRLKRLLGMPPDVAPARDANAGGVLARAIAPDRVDVARRPGPTSRRPRRGCAPPRSASPAPAVKAVPMSPCSARTCAWTRDFLSGRSAPEAGWSACAASSIT